MATIPAASPRSVEADETRFFFIMSCAMAASLVAGFGLNAALGRSTFASPLMVHVHAFTMFGWTVLYVVQNWLMMTGRRAWHKKLGWLAVAWIPLVLGMGMWMTVHSLRTIGGPPFFDQSEFLFGNNVGLWVAMGIVVWALMVRRNTGWHRRLMFGAMAFLTGPGIGRLLPAPLFIPWAWWVVNLVPLIFPVIGMMADRKRYGRIHPAWAVPFIGFVLFIGIGDALAYSDWGQKFTQDLIAGTPGAQRSPQAFFPQ